MNANPQTEQNKIKQSWMNGENFFNQNVNDFSAIPADADINELIFCSYLELVEDF